MPELPEVETLRSDLTKVLKGKTISSAEIGWPKMVQPLSVLKFKQKIKNKEIKNVFRRGKMLIFDLTGDLFLIIHLKMTGQLIYIPSDYKPFAISHKLVVGGHPQKGGLDNLPNRFTYVIFGFQDGSTLFFNDMRKFGWARLVDQKHLDDIEDNFGIEPLTKNFTLEKFEEAIKRYPKRKIKQSLLDQKLIAGVGNIYVDESCFCAKIKPARLAGSLKQDEIKKLYQCLLKILKLSIEKRGTSFNTYVDSTGKQGGFVPYLKVYGRGGKKCKRCQAILTKTKLGGRGTVYCSGCQK